MKSILKISLDDIQYNWKLINTASNGKAAEVVKGEIGYVPEHSGTFMIKQVNHQFNMTDSRNVYTVLDLVRDSQGIKDQESKVK